MTERKVLIICGQEIIFGKKDGGKQGSLKNYKLLQQVFGKDNVYLCMLTNNDIQSENNIIRFPAHKTFINRIVNILHGNLFTSQKVENTIISFIKKEKFDIVYFDRSMFGSIIDKIIAEEIPCKLWVFMHNIEKNYFLNKVKHQNILFFFPYLKIIESERKTIDNADYIITMTHRDAELLYKIYGKKCDLVLPMSFDDVFKEENIRIHNGESGKEILFIGTMFPPNYDGIKWFVEEVMNELPEYILKIVGKGFEIKRKKLERKNVEVIGYVDNLEDYYYADNIIVMPIFYGDGLKIKTAEAMMYGKIILATDEALEGYNVEGNDDIYRCNSKKDFLEAIKDVYIKKKHGYSASVRRLFSSKYSLDYQIEECRKIWT